MGVSTALVSYVLNNKKEGRIKKSVAERIREVATELNYRTNQIAKSLKTNKTFTIGLIISDISNPFFANLARIIEDKADKYNYTVLFGSSDENEQRSKKLIDTFLNRQVDGLIICPGENDFSLVLPLVEQNVPFVLVDRYFPEIKTNYVALDNYAASFMAVQHLVDSGRRAAHRVAEVGEVADRIGHLEAVEHHRARLLPELVHPVEERPHLFAARAPS